jgi:23S rRNA (guanosine2251-2'-O)-methyltransferase
MGKKMAGLGIIIEGKNAVLSVLESGRATKISYLNQENKKENFESILNLAKKNKVEIATISSKEEWPYHPRHSIVALCNPKKTYKEKDLDRFTDKNFIVCDHIQDTNNIGAIARSAAAFNFEVIAIPLKRSVKITERTFSIASGGLEKVEILFYNSIFSLIKKFNSMDIWTIGLDMTGEMEINNVDLKKQKYALFVGSEENGLSKEVQKKLDLISRINMDNDIESLNVSVSAAVAMHQLFIKK